MCVHSFYVCVGVYASAFAPLKCLVCQANFIILPVIIKRDEQQTRLNQQPEKLKIHMEVNLRPRAKTVGEINNFQQNERHN